MSDSCPARYDSAVVDVIRCDLPAEPKHKEHVNEKTGARWHDDYVPKPEGLGVDEEGG